MTKIPGYEILATLEQRTCSASFLATPAGEPQEGETLPWGYLKKGAIPEETPSVVIRQISTSMANSSEVALACAEYESLAKVESSAVVKIFEIIKLADSVNVVFEKSMDPLLAEHLKPHGVACLEDVVVFLNFALSLVSGIEELHNRKLMLRNLTPRHLSYNPTTKGARIVDFGTQQLITKEHQRFYDPDVLENLLPYMSPEQTGRMNRSVDFRSDFYSLGMVFYHFLTGKPPFVFKDPLETIHSHIARAVQPPSALNPLVPGPIDAIVGKLLAKTAEDRYQSCFGLRTDLEYCLEEVNNLGQIDGFCPGKRDLASRFQIPEKLYGREREAETLMEIFSRACQGERQLAFVCGAPGIGKTCLIREIHQPIVAHRGYFTAGKYDQYLKDQPYSAIVQAFRGLIRQLLSESDDRVRRWKKELQAAFTGNGQVIVDVIPELELILGAQPPMPDLGGIEKLNVFKMAFQSFISVFAKESHPLVLFLDDLQWADLASFQLLETIIGALEMKYLFIIGSYRDNEVDGSHPFTFLLNTLKKEQVAYETITLGPLQKEHLSNMVRDTLELPREEAEDLTELLFRKTQGNPFFAKEFFQTVYAEGALRFDFEKGWSVDMASASEIPATDNVVQLLASKIHKYGEEVQDAIKWASCIGHRFDLETLGYLQNRTTDEMLELFAEPLGDGLIGFAAVGYFFHDRIHEAAYQIIGERERITRHHRVGSYLLKKAGGRPAPEDLMFVTDQLNIGRELITKEEEKQQLIELNLQAGRRAKSSNAYQSARQYLETVEELLGKECWQKQSQICLELHTELAETGFLLGDTALMRSHCDQVIRRSVGIAAKVKIYEIMIQEAQCRGDLKSAVSIAIDALNELGEKATAHPSKLRVLIDLLKTKRMLRGKTDEDILNAPEMTDPHKLGIMLISYRAGPTMFFVSKELMAVNIFLRVRLSLQYGNAPETVAGLVSYALICCGVLRKFEEGYRFGKLSLALLDKYNLKEYRGSTNFRFNAFVRHWKEPVTNGLVPLRDAFRDCIETGDLDTAGYPTFLYAIIVLFSGGPIDQHVDDIDSFLAGLEGVGEQFGRRVTQGFRQAIENLISGSEDPGRLKGEFLDEDALIPIYEKDSNITGLFCMYMSKMFLSYLFGDFDEAYKNATIARPYIGGVTSSYLESMFYMHEGLILLSVRDRLSKAEQSRADKLIRADIKLLKKFARSCETNYGHKLLLVEAELARVNGAQGRAHQLYQTAIDAAVESGFVNEAAIGCELYARFVFNRGNRAFAELLLQKSLAYFEKWGALAKVHDMRSKYGDLLPEKHMATLHQAKLSHAVTTHQNSQIALDFGSFVKTATTISSEIVLEKLLSTLMSLLIENAGAKRGAIILLADTGKLMVEAEADLDEQPLEQAFQPLPLEKANLPEQLIQYVFRTKETVIFNTGDAETRFPFDPYLLQHKPKSVLSLPLLNKGEMVGIVYLENDIASDAFTAGRREILEALSAQVAVSLDNAKLYRDLARTNESLNQALIQAKTAARVKRDFLSSTSHELKTPLNTIINIPEWLLNACFRELSTFTCEDCDSRFEAEEGETVDESTVCPGCGTVGSLKAGQMVDFFGDPQKARRQLTNVIHAGRHLLTIVEDILDISKLEAGRMEIFPERLALKEIFENVIAVTAALAESKNINLQFDVDEDSVVLVADKAKTSQIFINIIGNAIKFSPYAGIIRVKVEGAADEILFAVTDEGVGISEEDQKVIFQAFRQAEGGTTRSYGGTGLGLAITRQLVELHGGEIWVESEVGKGSTFFVRLPRVAKALRPSLVNQLGGVAPTPDYQESILVIDDDAAVLEASTLVLNGLGYAVESVSDTAEIIEKIEAINPKLIMLEMIMPNVNGLSILQQIRKSDNLREKPVIVSSEFYSHGEILTELGAHWLAKPWTHKELSDKISKILS